LALLLFSKGKSKKVFRFSTLESVYQVSGY